MYTLDVSTYYNAYAYKELYIKPVTGGFTAPSNTTIKNALELRAEIKEEVRTLVPITPATLINVQQTQFITVSSVERACKFTWGTQYCKPYAYEFQLMRLYNTSTVLANLRSEERRVGKECW